MNNALALRGSLDSLRMMSFAGFDVGFGFDVDSVQVRSIEQNIHEFL